MRRFVHRWQMNILKQKLNHHRGTIKQCPQYWRYHNNWARIYTCTCSPEYLYTKLEIEQVIVTALDSSTLRRRRCYSAPLHGRNPLCFPTCLQIFHKVCRVFALQIQPGDSTKQTQKQIAGRATDHQLSSTSSLSLVSKSGWRYAKRVPSQVSAAFFFHFQTSKDWIYAFDGQGRHLLTLTADTSLITIVGWDNTTIRKPIARTKQRVHRHLTPCACVLPGILCAHHVLKDMTNQKQVGRNYYWHRIRIILWRFC